MTEQKPVGKFAKFTDGIWREVTDGSAGTPLYTAPPQRTWVGLTDDDIWDAFGGRIGTSNSDVNPIRLLADARKIEAKLKDKNT